MAEHDGKPPLDGGSIPTPSLQFVHNEARKRFEANPIKCYQRHVRELWQEIDRKPQLLSLQSARVLPITRAEAQTIILKYEWLAGDPLNKAPMGYGVKAYYGLVLNDELLGAVCFGTAGGQIRNICGQVYNQRTISLVRGACAPHAPKNAGSFLVSHACRQATKDFGWCVFFAYSDPDAGEIGTIYSACNWHYLGVRAKSGVHRDYISPDGKRIIKSHALNHDHKRKILRSLGWRPEITISMRRWLREQGWTEKKRYPKHTWVWFEGSQTEKENMLAAAKSNRGYEPLSYRFRKKETRELDKIV